MSKVKCLKCGVILHSTYRHDFVQCDCENQTFVDGGYDYCRCGGVDMKLVQFIEDPRPDDYDDEENKRRWWGDEATLLALLTNDAMWRKFEKKDKKDEDKDGNV